MADEIMEAIQMLRFGYDGIKLGIDVTGSSIREAKNLTIFIVGLLNHEKTQGKTSLRKMLKNSGNLQVLQIKENHVWEFEKMAKKYGILYSKMPDINKGDGMTEYIFPVEATPRINALIEKLGNGRLEDIAEYVKNGEGNVKETMDYLKKKNLLPQTPLSVTAERKKEMDNAARNIKYNENINDLEKTDITISTKLVAGENKDYFLTENVRYLAIKKEDIITINNRKTFLTFLNKDQEYELLDRNKKPAGKMCGEELRNNHYDKVEEEIRKRANRQRDREKEKQKKQTANRKQTMKKNQERAMKSDAKKR